jgi:hypothetical protein
MAFLDAMNSASAAPAGMTTGVNGASVYTAEGVGDKRVAFYQSLVRGASYMDILQFVGEVYAEGRAKGKVEEYVRDLWVMAFQARDVRGGKGERKISEMLLHCLIDDTRLWAGHCGEVVTMLAEYGSWRDVFAMWDLMADKFVFREAILRTVEGQFWNDLQALRNKAEGRKVKISLLAKWLPREGSAMDKSGLVGRIVERLYPLKKRTDALRTYRRHCSEINKALHTVEIRMCGGTWAKIKPEAVPGRALKNYRLAFLNKKKDGKQRSEKEDRVLCASKFKALLEKVLAGKATVKGGDTVMPHEIVKSIADARSTSEDELSVLEAQWSAIREKVLADSKVVSKMVPMCDFSGSMSGIPYYVSMGLGILLSEVTHEAFRGGMLTFDSTPQWLQFATDQKLRDKVRATQGAGQGLSTNFEAALQLVLDRLVEKKVPVGEEPEDLVVFTDMGFNEALGPNSAEFHHRMKAKGGWETIVEGFQRKFTEASKAVWPGEKPGEGWKMPRIVIWNLRAAFKEYSAKADRKGVLALSGWSPSGMKVLTSGIQLSTSYESMRCVLDDARYDRVRTFVRETEYVWSDMSGFGSFMACDEEADHGAVAALQGLKAGCNETL